MSLRSWKAEFMPIPATKASTFTEAARHSILKHSGLLPGNLKRHKVKLVNLIGGPAVVSRWYPFWPRAIYRILIEDTCALCQVTKKQNSLGFKECRRCPLFAANECCHDWISVWRDEYQTLQRQRSTLSERTFVVNSMLIALRKAEVHARLMDGLGQKPPRKI